MKAVRYAWREMLGSELFTRLVMQLVDLDNKSFDLAQDTEDPEWHKRTDDHIEQIRKMMGWQGLPHGGANSRFESLFGETEEEAAEAERQEQEQEQESGETD